LNRQAWDEDCTVAISISIPTLPITRMRALALITNDDPSLDELTQAVDPDVAITAALLRVANSAASSPIQPVRTARVAIVRMGLLETKRIVLSATLSSAFGGLSASGINQDALWKHLISTALLADGIAWGEIRHGEAFTAGLLHDIGRLAMAEAEPSRYSAVVGLARRGVPTSEAEQLVFGMDHTQWGDAISRAWGFPSDLVTAIAGHHTGAESGLAWAVGSARELSAALGMGDGVVDVDPFDEDDLDDAMAATIKELGGAEGVLERVDKYLGVLPVRR
jgi:putative nucleotidyltransferase with HDIG domain